MWRKALSAALIGLALYAPPAWADTGGRGTAATTSSATPGSKRTLWTIVGIGAGFGAGLLIGLGAFDDAIDSDRKVWTTALVAAAAGGLAGNLLGKNLGRTPPVRVDKSRRPVTDLRNVPWPAVTVAPDDGLRQRVRAVNVLAAPAR